MFSEQMDIMAAESSFSASKGSSDRILILAIRYHLLAATKFKLQQTFNACQRSKNVTKFPSDATKNTLSLHYIAFTDSD